MTLTEEEKKKQSKSNYQQELNNKILSDETYKTSKESLEKQKQKDLEEAYVNQELMNKYLNQSLAEQGLANSGIANLYKQQANTNYMNTRANISNEYQQDQLDLYNKYYDQKKAEQDASQKLMYDMYSEKIQNMVNDYDFIDEDSRITLSDYINENSNEFGEDYQNLLLSQLDLYKPNEDKIKLYNEANYKTYLDELHTKIGDAQGITDEDYDILISELEGVKGKIGESNYNNAIQTLTAYKTMGDVLETINESGKISSTNYKQLKESIDKLKEEGAITTASYNEIKKNLDALKTTVEQEKADYQKKLQEGLFDSENADANAVLYSRFSDDAEVEKFVRLAAAGVVNNFKDIGKSIADWWKENIWD